MYVALLPRSFEPERVYTVPSNTHQATSTGTTLSTVTDILENPSRASSSETQLALTQLPPSSGYTAIISGNIITLSLGDASYANPVNGFLYVPTLDASDQCNQASSDSDPVPDNVTRRKDLPDIGDLPLLAFAPWRSGVAGCRLQTAYLDKAKADGAQGFLFFLDGNSTDTPPGADATVWYIPTPQGQATGWTNKYEFPIFAIPSATGNELLEQSVLYSKNMSQVPHGAELTQDFNPIDYVRLVSEVDIAVPSNLPSLWILLLCVLAIVLTLMGTTSLVMHWLQARRRKDLRRRVENGEVDLEALGIKRLTVPQEVLDEMPLYTYGSGVAVIPAEKATGEATTTTTTPPTTSTAKSTTTKPPDLPRTTTSPAPKNSSWPAPFVRPTPDPSTTRSTSHIPTLLLQPTCPICLEEFIPATPSTRGTTVRELPCQHIFHPECVDAFLKDSSSLCPMCKCAALPKGYCPRKITNAMVRRERILRRRGPEAAARVASFHANMTPRRRSRMVSWGQGVTGLSPYNERNGMARSSQPPRQGTTQAQAQGTEMVPLPPPTAATATASAAALEAGQASSETTPAIAPETAGEGRVQPPSNPRRREWARQRALSMLGGGVAPADPDAEEARTMPRWRKAVLRVFPAVGR